VGGSPSWGWAFDVGRLANESSPKNKLVMKCLKGPQNSMDVLQKRYNLKQMDMRFGTWIVRSLYRAGSLMAVAFSGNTRSQLGRTWH
jgi:hypothetical protein